ncbi:hypothetical protein U8047_006513, partial [Pseudomonas aeruginosa]|jgi:hypothetical protein|nr:hypothetical protein [Pseudomonas aeruginosa]EMB9257747.1 hypothetical protein [Pseudomonas aeruginosa]
MKVAFYDAEHCCVGPRHTFPDWTPDDARLYAMTLQDPSFDHLDWLLVWDDKPAPGTHPFRSVFFLGGLPWTGSADITEQRIEQAFAQVIGH